MYHLSALHDACGKNERHRGFELSMKSKKPPVQNAQKAFESSNRFSKTLIPLGVRMFNVFMRQLP